MFKQFEFDQPTTMTAIAQAVWNNEKGVWEVSLSQNGTHFSALAGQFVFYQSSHHIEVEDCDEFVIADALLHANGINVQSIYQSAKNPIVKSEKRG